MQHLQILRQRKHLYYHEFRLLRHGISCERGAMGGSFAGYTVPYESISPEPYVVSVPMYRKQIPFIGIGIAAAGIFFFPGSYLSIAGICLGAIILMAYFHARRTKYLAFQLDKHYQVAFLENNPTKDEVEKFIKLMQEARAEYLKEKYQPMFLQSSPTEELGQLHFLKEQGAITEEEFLKIKNDLLKDITGEKKSPGFLN